MGKYISLTFDDGPTIGITNQVLDLIEQYKISASFFLITEKISEETIPLIKRALSLGCTIENHTITHPFLTKLSDEEILHEFKEASRMITEVTGDEPQFLRPPYIDVDDRVRKLITLPLICGQGCNDWELDIPADYRVKSVVENAKPGQIVLLHDMDDNVNTVEALKTIIPALLEQGYELVNVRDLFKKTGVEPKAGVMYTETGIEG